MSSPRPAATAAGTTTGGPGPDRFAQPDSHLLGEQKDARFLVASTEDHWGKTGRRSRVSGEATMNLSFQHVFTVYMFLHRLLFCVVYFLFLLLSRKTPSSGSSVDFVVQISKAVRARVASFYLFSSISLFRFNFFFEFVPIRFPAQVTFRRRC